MTYSWAEMQNDAVGLHLEGGTVCYSITTLLILTHTQLQKEEARGGRQVQPSLRWVKSTAVPTMKTHFLTEWLMSDCLCLKNHKSRISVISFGFKPVMVHTLSEVAACTPKHVAHVLTLHISSTRSHIYMYYMSLQNETGETQSSNPCEEQETV